MSLYRRLIWLRKQNSALCLGTYQTVDADNPNIFAYIRRLGKQKFLVVLNFSGEKERAVFNSLKNIGSIVISTRLDRSEQVLPENFILSPYEGCLIKMK
ncbi:MAG: alpha-glucosidase C-terminal domain-containing protein [Nitrospinae bacterium]|nr:alpha-glucosidase C-terminal domain-containing protein [Nitrospinota bacterium]